MRQVAEEIIRYREMLRLERRWEEADKIRDELVALGLEISDSGPITKYLWFKVKRDILPDLLKIRDKYVPRGDDEKHDR